MTKEQLDALLYYIDVKISFWAAEYPSPATAKELARAQDALYATIEKHTPLENVSDAELCGLVED